MIPAVNPLLQPEKVLSLSIGNFNSVAEYRQALEENKIGIGEKAIEMISRPNFLLSGEKKIIKIGFFSVLSLLPNSISPTNY